MAQEVRALQHMLDQIEQAKTEQDRVSLGAIVQAVGTGSFGPLLPQKRPAMPRQN